MKLSDMADGDEALEGMRKDPGFDQVWDDQEVARAFALVVVKFRADVGLTQAEFAEATGIPFDVVARVENGEGY